ncbi:MAG: RIP metalloprotease RseP [Melioribacteraceae bacterium]|nr:MAG: RIP metalloprotease RseP [Melioribacteraceae bacterium]
MDYIIYFAITIGILVFVHELGHFLAAKMSGMRAEVFAIGYGRRILGYNKITGFTFGPLPKDFDGEGNTDYRISLLPLGGYVKISGMIDESFDTEFAKSEPKDYEFRAKPTYKKLFVISAGVMMNLTLTILILWGINFFQGKQIIDTTDLGYVEENTPAAQAGFETNDKILSINGKTTENWDDIVNNLLIDNIGKDVNVTVLRGGEEVSFKIQKELIAENAQKSFMIPFGHTQPYISEIMKNSPAEAAGIQAGDIFLEMNGMKLNNSHEAIRIISSNPEKEISLVLLRDEDTVTTTVKSGYDGKIGIYITDVYTGPIKFENYGFFGSLFQSFENITQITALTFSMFKNVIVGDVQFDQVFGGPVKIAQFAARSADTGIISFLYFLAMLSLSLAILNFLPFPVLDGGHFVIIIIEGIMRKELPVKIKIAIQNFGFIVLLMLMAFIIYSDIMSL